jgi:hypothetical protein
MAAQGENSHSCTPWFRDISATRLAKDFGPINPTVEAALLRINWRKDRGLVDKFGFPEHYFVGNFGEVDFKKFCICRAGRKIVMDLAKSQGVQLPVPVVENKVATSGGRDWNRTCQVCKAKGGSGIKKPAQMASGYMDSSDHSKGRWCIKCRSNAANNKRKAEAKKAAAAAEPEAVAPNLAATAAPPSRGP